MEIKQLFNWLIALGVIFLLIGGFLIVIEFILYPSYLSVQWACYGLDDEELEKKGYILSGIYDSTCDEITIYKNDTLHPFKPDSRTMKHEKIHQFQQKKGRLDYCDKPMKLFVDECEAYFGQYLPNKIYYSIYE